MKILVDTHIFIWWSGPENLLSASAKSQLNDPRNTLVLSVASVWEMQIKLAVGKLELRLPLDELVRQQQENIGLEILDVTLPHVFALENLPFHHKDPFDRLLIAQAKAENLPVLTADAIFFAYDVNVLA